MGSHAYERGVVLEWDVTSICLTSYVCVNMSIVIGIHSNRIYVHTDWRDLLSNTPGYKFKVGIMTCAHPLACIRINRRPPYLPTVKK